MCDPSLRKHRAVLLGAVLRFGVLFDLIPAGLTMTYWPGEDVFLVGRGQKRLTEQLAKGRTKSSNSPGCRPWKRMRCAPAWGVYPDGITSGPLIPGLLTIRRRRSTLKAY